MLFWYTGQLRTFHAGVAEAVGEQARIPAGTERRPAAAAGSARRTADASPALERRHEQQALGPLRALAEQLDLHTQEFRAKQDALDHSLVRQAERWTKRAGARTAPRQVAAAIAQPTRASKPDRHSPCAPPRNPRRRFCSRRTRSASMPSARRASIDRRTGSGSRRRRRPSPRESIADHLTRLDETQAALTRSVDAGSCRLRGRLHEANTQLLQQQLRLTMLLREARGNTLADNAGPPDSAVADEMRHLHDPLSGRLYPHVPRQPRRNQRTG